MLLEYVACNGCESRDLAPVRSARSHYGPELYQIVRCTGCGLVFVNPRPAGKHDEIAARTTTVHIAPGPAERHRRTVQGRFVLARLRRFRTPGTFLDFGCGKGFLVHEAARAGWSAWGVELNTALAEAARAYWKTDRIVSWDLETLRLHRGASFDVVNASQVFEHLPDPLGTARDLAALLRDGGLLAVDVPNVRSVHYRLRRGAAFDPTAHLYHFSASSLTALLARAGLEVVEARTSATLLGVLPRLVADPDRAAALAQRLHRLPTVGFGLNVVAVKRPAATAAATGARDA
jgi:2-polyprenyl-3-methyl-5-hydroxy-6-metoxy-1,4-benzoquinol methylase